jgi:hypothetical protein
VRSPSTSAGLIDFDQGFFYRSPIEGDLTKERLPILTWRAKEPLLCHVRDAKSLAETVSNSPVARQDLKEACVKRSNLDNPVRQVDIDRIFREDRGSQPRLDVVRVHRDEYAPKELVDRRQQTDQLTSITKSARLARMRLEAFTDRVDVGNVPNDVSQRFVEELDDSDQLGAQAAKRTAVDELSLDSYDKIHWQGSVSSEKGVPGTNAITLWKVCRRFMLTTLTPAVCHEKFNPF